MSISRKTFNPDNNYKRVNYHQDRDLLDSELNEQQDIFRHEQRKITDTLLQDGAIIRGLELGIADNILTITEGAVYIDGSIESAPGATLAYEMDNPAPHYVYVELLKYDVTKNQDSSLVNPATGEDTAEREKWVTTLNNTDTTDDPLPALAISRRVLPIYKVEIDTGLVTPIVRRKSNLRLDDHRGTLPGNQITVSSITENQISLPANEGRNSLLQNMAERTYDQSGSFVVVGLDSVIGNVHTNHVEVVTNAGRAYVNGYRFDAHLSTTTIIPKSTAFQSVRGELKTFFPNERRCPVDHTPLKESTLVEAIFEKTATITRGPAPGGLDLLTPNPVVDILEVRQGGTTYEKDVDWQQSGDHIDWLSSGNEPAVGSTYVVRWIYSKELTKGTDYVDGGWFGQPDYPEPTTYFYYATPVMPSGESTYYSSAVVSRATGAGEINVVSWNSVELAQAYRVYRGVGSGPYDLELLAEIDSETTSFVDDGVDEIIGGNPPTSGTVNLDAYPLEIAPGNRQVINFAKMDSGDYPLAGSTLSVDYDFYIGRQDVIYTSRQSVGRKAGAPAVDPKVPIVPNGTLGLCSVYCPPNSTNVKLTNFGLMRVPMDRLYRFVQEMEDLKNQVDLMAMREEIQIRESETIKAIFSDNFANTSHFDVDHPEWNARIDTVGKFVAPDRVTTRHLLEVDHENSNAMFVGNSAMLPADEVVLMKQTDWSEDRQVKSLAQTFSLPKDQVVSGVGLRFTQKDDANSITIQIRGLTNGLPSDVVIAEAVVTPGDINLEGETKVVFSEPVRLQANDNYALVLHANSPTYRVKTATFGQLGQNGIITVDLSSGSLLLESGDAQSWTPLDDSALTMSLHGYEFESLGEVRFQEISSVEFSELQLDVASVQPDGSGITWEYSTDGGISWYAIVTGIEERLSDLASRVIVRAVLIGTNDNDTPIFNFKTVTLLGYLNNFEGVYISKEIVLSDDVSTAKIYAQMDIPEGSNVNWFASNDGGETLVSITMEATREVDQIWTEYVGSAEFTRSTGNRVRFKGEMMGGVVVLPRVGKVGATIL